MPSLLGGSYGHPLYALTLIGRAPQHLTLVPPQRSTGDPALGRQLMAGRLRLLGRPIDWQHPPWADPGLDPLVLAELDAFDWLDDLAILGEPAAQECARKLVLDWAEADRGWSPIGWRADVLGRRIAAILGNARFLHRGDEDDLGDRILPMLSRQHRHLARVATREVDGLGRLQALRGLLFGALCGLGREGSARRGAAALSTALASQVAADGSHVERSPAATLEALECLLDIRDCLRAAGAPPPAGLDGAVAGLAGAVAFFRLGDGGLTLFNDTNETGRPRIEAALARAGEETARLPPGSLGGFQRLAAGPTVILMDAAAPPPPGLDARAHAGCLAFEMSVGRERLIVNCGAFPSADPAWRRAQRVGAAHSTLTVDEQSPAEVLPSGGLGARPQTVAARREEGEGSVWVDASHDGYVRAFDLVHRRRLYLSADGLDLRGEDTLVGPHRGTAAIRFHLHPEAQASVAQNGQSALIRLGARDHWRLQASGGVLSVGESIYLGRRGEARKNEQLVVTVPLTGHGASVKWALKRAAKA